MSTELYTVIILALLPAVGNLVGGLVAEWIPMSKKLINYSLHIASGIIISLVAVEVFPNSLGKAPTWKLSMAFLIGGLFYLFIKSIIAKWQENMEGGEGTGAWMVYIAVVFDLIGDGLLIGAASVISFELAILLALAQVAAGIPTGFATIANFKDKGTSTLKRLLLSASFVIPILLAALFSYFILKEQNESVQVSGLVFVAGIYVIAAVEDLIGEGHEAYEDNKLSAVYFLIGFVLFMVASSFG
jgi:ZIP family zinc transporter|tara:strand:+ start:347 stop:1078 length:732 start_codon:yes stop_codon:yes gene_type:complete